MKAAVIAMVFNMLTGSYAVLKSYLCKAQDYLTDDRFHYRLYL